MRNALLVISLIAIFAFFLYVAVNPGDFGGNTGDHLIFGEPRYSCLLYTSPSPRDS